MNKIDYTFTTDFFTANIPLWSQLFDQFGAIARILEIGSFEGRSAVWMIERIAATRPLAIHCVDTWLGSREHERIDMTEVERRFDHNVSLGARRAKFLVDLKKHKGRSAEVLATLIANKEPPFDFIYIDGSHAAPDVLADAVLSYELLKVGGLLVFDDYHWKEYYRPWEERRLQNETKLGVDFFQLAYTSRFNVLNVPTVGQVFLVKQN